MNFEHTSVLLDECIKMLDIKPGGVYLDGTMGGAGHSAEISKRLTDGILVGVDQDADAIEKSKNVLAQYGKRVRVVRANFAEVEYIAEQAGVVGFDGILLDLGVSSYQLDEPSRGFSYNNDALLDMRMDNRQNFSAHDVVNKYSEKELTRIISEYSEERWAVRIAQFIVNERLIKPIETTRELGAVILKAVPKGARADGPHPAKRTFQAIRIEVNNELGILEKAIKELALKLNSRGRICVINFHSLEDRIIKNVSRELSNPCICPRDFPVCVCEKKPSVKIITRKPIIPSKVELERNHRARSAKLRVAEKL